MHKCTSCSGSGMILCHIGGIDEHRWENRKCPVCNGTGEITKKVLDAMAKGKELRAQRVASGLTIRDIALLEGISIAEVCKRESGWL